MSESFMRNVIYPIPKEDKIYEEEYKTIQTFRSIITEKQNQDTELLDELNIDKTV